MGLRHEVRPDPEVERGPVEVDHAVVFKEPSLATWQRCCPEEVRYGHPSHPTVTNACCTADVPAMWPVNHRQLPSTFACPLFSCTSVTHRWDVHRHRWSTLLEGVLEVPDVRGQPLRRPAPAESAAMDAARVGHSPEE